MPCQEHRHHSPRVPYGASYAPTRKETYMDRPSDSVATYLDSLPLHPKKTGVGVPLELIAYPDGHAAIGSHPLNGKEELMKAVGYLFDRAQAEATKLRAG